MKNTKELLLISKQNASENLLTMSSREIAELCEKRHDNVMADIDKMLSELEIQSPDFLGDYKDSKGRTYRCYNLPKDLTITLIAGYNVKLRKKIIDRWQELENQQSPKIPQTLPEALRLAADLAEQNQALQLESKQKSEQIDSMASYFRNGISPFEFVKGLNGVNSLKVGAFLVDKNWLYQDGNHKRVKAYARDQYLTEETTEISQHGKDPFVAYKPVLLKKGAAKLYEWYTLGKLPMKSNWNGEFTQDKAVGL